jgi:hypothetical protein
MNLQKREGAVDSNGLGSVLAIQPPKLCLVGLESVMDVDRNEQYGRALCPSWVRSAQWSRGLESMDSVITHEDACPLVLAEIHFRLAGTDCSPPPQGLVLIQPPSNA